MESKRLGDLLPPEKITEGSKRAKAALSPFFPQKGSPEIPPEFKWVDGVLDRFFTILRRTTLKAVQPFWQYPPFEHIDVDIQARVTIAVGATSTLVTFTVPQHQYAVVRMYGQDIEATPPGVTPGTCWDDIAWTFKVGGFPLQYFDAFTGERGSLINMRPTAIVVKGPETFLISVKNNGAISYDVTASIIGHQYSLLASPAPKEDVF